MSRRLVPLIIAASVLGACSINDDIPDTFTMGGRLVERSYDVEPFQAISLDANAKIQIIQSDEQSVVINTEADHFDYLEVFTEEGVLYINHIDDHSRKRHTSIVINTTQLDRLTIDAIVDAEVSDIEAEDFQLTFDGIGSFVIEGECDSARYMVDGIGDFEAHHFYCNDVYARFDGIGSLSLYAEDTLDLDADGIGDVSVYGSPRRK